MYDPEKKQYILKNSLGVYYHVYFEPDRGLCLRMLSDNYVWSRGFVLASNAVNDFSVALDSEDFLHFVFQSRDGSIMYGHGKHGQIETKPILNSRDATPWPKHLNLLISGDTVIIFYKIRYSGRHLISMQTVRDGMVSKPLAIDYSDGSGPNYSVFLDNNEKCHIVYSIAGSARMHLLYREMKEDFSIFNAPKTIYSSDGNIYFPSAAVDPDNKIHLLFQVHYDDFYEILYKNLSSVKPVQTLHKSSSPLGFTGILQKSGTLYCFRTAGSGILARNSRDGGKNWSAEAPVNFSSSGELTCFIFRTNFKKEKETFYSNEVPGNFSHGYQLAFISEDSPDISDLKDYSGTAGSIFDNFSIVGGKPADRTRKIPDNDNKESTSDDQYIKKIENKLLQLQSITENMQRDLTKHWLLFKEIEKKLDKLNRLYEEYSSGDEDGSESEWEKASGQMPYSEKEYNEKKNAEKIPDSYDNLYDYSDDDTDNDSDDELDSNSDYDSDYGGEEEDIVQSTEGI